MTKANRTVASNYEQPAGNFIGRTLKGSYEEVEYMPESHLRIWYNTQTEGYAMHHHNALEIIICMEDQYTIIANNQTFLLTVGDILIIPPHMLHEIRESSSGVRFIMLANIDLFSPLQDFKTVDPIFIKPYFCNSSSHPEIYQQLYSAFMQIIDIYFSNTFLWETSIYSHLLNIFSLIGRDYYHVKPGDKSDSSGMKQKEYYKKFSMLLEYINDNYAEDLTLEQMADYVGFSKYHFSRLFKQYADTTFYNYLCHKRVAAAQELLSSDMPITDIAFQTGFNNLTTFCRCFKKCTNCSPTEYRNKFQHEQIRS